LLLLLLSTSGPKIFTFFVICRNAVSMPKTSLLLLAVDTKKYLAEITVFYQKKRNAAQSVFGFLPRFFF